MVNTLKDMVSTMILVQEWWNPCARKWILCYQNRTDNKYQKDKGGDRRTDSPHFPLAQIHLMRVGSHSTKKHEETIVRIYEEGRNYYMHRPVPKLKHEFNDDNAKRSNTNTDRSKVATIVRKSCAQ